jgi:hypothetical protein
VSVLVPARDEAGQVGDCIHALRAQTGLDASGLALELLVLDDASTDGTAEAARTACGGDPRVRVLTGASPPAGWLGKPHACAQLAAAAGGDVLVFVDADVVVAPDGIAATVGLLDSGLDLVSPYARQLADGAGPRLVQPLLQWSWLTFLPLGLVERLPTPSLTAANGQLLACSAQAYAAAGGHAAVADRVLDDVALARAFKRAGLTATVADGTQVATCRMYGSWGELIEGYTKSLWAAFGSPVGAVACMAALGWLYLTPPVEAVRGLAEAAANRPGGQGTRRLVAGRQRRVAVGLTGYAAGVAGRWLAARRTGSRRTDAALHPISVLALVWLTAVSWWRRATGRLSWKQRPVEADGTAGATRQSPVAERKGQTERNGQTERDGQAG